MKTHAAYYIRCRHPEAKRADLLAADGGRTLLKRHAALIPAARIEGCLAELREQTAGWEFSAVPVKGKVKR